MVSNKCTLIIDGNWLLMSRLGPRFKDFSNSFSTDDLERSSDDLVEFLAQSVNKIINFFNDNIDNIIMVQDGGSWRRKFQKPKLYTETYKGNRVLQDDVNWDYIWRALRKFCTNFHENGITCTQAPNIEGDDWCWFWSRYLNHNDTNVIIWTSDCDLKQLVQKDPTTNRWTVWYNDRSGLCVHECYNPESIDEVDRFFSIQDYSLDKLIRDVSLTSHRVSYVYPDDIRMDKIICGDVGDNIKPIVSVTKSTGRTNRISSKEWNVIRESLNINNLQDLLGHRREVIDNILSIKRLHDCLDSVEDIDEMMLYNFYMVVLDKEWIPVEWRNVMKSHVDDYTIADLDYIRNNYKVLSSRDQNAMDTLEDLFSSLEINSSANPCKD